MSRPERYLGTSLAFGGYDSPFDPEALTENDLPMPRPGEPLLSDPTGSESGIRSYESWGFSKLAGLRMFAYFYEERARELVRVRLDSPDGAENFVYPVGFLYRHCIELNMKAAIVRSSWFRALDLEHKRRLFREHRLSRLWELLKPIVSEYMKPSEIEPFEQQLRELERLDATSQGFRYPFSDLDANTGEPGSLLEGLIDKSFDNLVWVLDGMAQWLAHTADIESDYREMQDYLGEP